MIDEKKLIEAFEAREMPAIDIIKEVINSQPKVGEWKPFEFGCDEDTGEGIILGEIPDCDQEILVTDGSSVWVDTFYIDWECSYLDSGRTLEDEVIAWKPMPEPWEGE